jgi:hypothetical protein
MQYRNRFPSGWQFLFGGVSLLKDVRDGPKSGLLGNFNISNR